MAVADTEKVHTPTDISSSFLFDERTVFLCVAAGKMHSGVVTEDGACYTWGGNKLGQLGIEGVETFTSTPSRVVEIEGRVASLACGYTQTIFIMEDRSLMICGQNDVGQLGVEDDSEVIDIPIPVQSLEERVASVCCSNFTAALTEDSNLYIWGETPNGMFVRPEKINGLAGIILQAAIGEDLICVLDENNFVYSWGRNEAGQLGLGDTEPQKDACSVDTLNDREILGLYAGRNFVLGLGRGPANKKENPLLNGSHIENENVVLEEETRENKDAFVSGEEEVSGYSQGFVGAEEEEEVRQENSRDGIEFEEAGGETFGRRTTPLRDESKSQGPEERVRAVSRGKEREKEQNGPQTVGLASRETDPLRSTEQVRSTDLNQREYQLPSSIIDLYKNQRPVEAIYPIEEVDRLQREHKILLQLVCAYEKTRQDLVGVLNGIVTENPRIIDKLDPRDIQNVLIKENFIENKLSSIQLDLNREIEDSGLKDVLSKHKCNIL